MTVIALAMLWFVCLFDCLIVFCLFVCLIVFYLFICLFVWGGGVYTPVIDQSPWSYTCLIRGICLNVFCLFVCLFVCLGWESLFTSN